MKSLVVIFTLFFSQVSFASKCDLNEDTILKNESFTNIFVGNVTKAYIEDFPEFRGGKRAVAEFELVEIIKGNPEKLNFVYFVNGGHSIMLGQDHLFVTDDKGFSHLCSGSGVINYWPISSTSVRSHIYYRLKDKVVQ